MYSGKMLDELMEMVARAEEHARTLKAEVAEPAPQPYVFYASRYIYDGATQPALVGVA